MFYKNTTRIKANAFGFYSINGTNVIDFKECSKSQSVCEFLEHIRNKNQGRKIVIIIDNFKSHHSKKTTAKAEELGIELLFLPPYSPDLNPIEFIWKSIKRVISDTFIKSKEHLRNIIRDEFTKLARSLSFAKRWIEKFKSCLGSVID